MNSNCLHVYQIWPPMRTWFLALASHFFAAVVAEAALTFSPPISRYCRSRGCYYCCSVCCWRWSGLLEDAAATATLNSTSTPEGAEMNKKLCALNLISLIKFSYKLIWIGRKSRESQIVCLRFANSVHFREIFLLSFELLSGVDSSRLCRSTLNNLSKFVELIQNILIQQLFCLKKIYMSEISWKLPFVNYTCRICSCWTFQICSGLCRSRSKQTFELSNWMRRFQSAIKK